MLKLQLSDLDLEGGTVLIHEKKRVKGKRSTRRAPLTPRLVEALRAWLAIHPGGNASFCQPYEVCARQEAKPDHRPRSGEERPTSLKSGVWSRVVFGDFSGGGLLPDAIDEDGPLDDLGQQRRTVQRSPTL